MTYAAEPYAVFADDLLANLTGGVSRLRFRFVDEARPFEIGDAEHPVPASVKVHGIVGGAFRQFGRGTDFDVVGTTVVWREDAAAPGQPDPSAAWPDDGTDFWVAFEREPGHHAPPVLTDRNPGSMTRTLAESFALEFAVISHQLEMVYEAAHLETATGRDLEQIVALVGLARRGQLHARGAVTFRRSTPADADITIAAGTLVSTAEPPLVTVETTQTTTLRRGTLAVSAPVRAQAEGPAGVAAAGALTVIHRPILGIEEVLNTQALAFGGGAEPDEDLRARARRALQTSGRSTVGAIRGALASLEHVREQDVMIEEDHLAFPGVVKVAIAADLDEETERAAYRLIEDHRPAGVRVVHDLQVPTETAPVVGDVEPGGGGDGPAGPGSVEGFRYPIRMRAVVTPASTELTPRERETLELAVIDAIRAHVDSLSVGQPVVYNRVVAVVMALEGVLDVVLDLSPTAAGPEPAGRVNLRPPSATRPWLGPDELEVTLGGALVALVVTVELERLGAAATADPSVALQAARSDVADRLATALLTQLPTITPAVLRGLLPDTETYRVTDLHYTAELVEEGLLVERTDVTIQLLPGQQPWIRQVVAAETVSVS